MAESEHIQGYYGGTNPWNKMDPTMWCTITATLSGGNVNWTYTVNCSSAGERWNIYNLSAVVGGKTVKNIGYIGYNDYSTPLTYTGSEPLSGLSIVDGKVEFSASLCVSNNWNSTSTSGSIPAGAPTVAAPTSSIISKGYPTSNPTTMVGDNTIVRITMAGTPSTTTHSAIKNYTLYIDGQKQTPTTNTYFDLPALSAGTHKVKYYATDNNGVDSNLSSELSLNYVAYTPARINSVLSQRCDSAGNILDDGTYGKFTLTYTAAKIGGNNIATYWKVKVGSAWTSANQSSSGASVQTSSAIISQSSSYQPLYSVWDAFQSSPTIDRQDLISVAGYGALDMCYVNGQHGIGFGAEATPGNADFAFTPRFRVGNTFYSLVDLIYPVGSIYMSVNSTDPSTLFIGTTWTRITDTFLYCGTDTAPGTGQIDYRPGNSGGDKNSVAHHTHTVGAVKWDSPSQWCSIDEYWGNVSHGATTSDANVAANDGNMPPWLAVYVWKRTA